MKRNLFICILAIVLFGFYSCEKDNLSAPNATFSGELRDLKTGDLLQQEISDGSRIYFIEQGWGENSPIQNLLIKRDGTFVNNMIFSGDYKIILDKGNYVPLDTIDLKIKEGKNFHVFKVTPYLRILDPQIIISNGMLVAKFKLEQVTAQKVDDIALFAHSHADVSNKVNSVVEKKEINRTIEDEESFELSINLKLQTSTLLEGRSYYFRIGAKSHGNQTKYNYSEAVKLVINSDL